MAHPLSVALDKAEGKKATPCNASCKYWRFPHLDTACVLSDVYSVPKGEPCFIFEAKPDDLDAGQHTGTSPRRG